MPGYVLTADMMAGDGCDQHIHAALNVLASRCVTGTLADMMADLKGTGADRVITLRLISCTVMYVIWHKIEQTLS
jgi:hypothetical protein